MRSNLVERAAATLLTLGLAEHIQAQFAALPCLQLGSHSAGETPANNEQDRIGAWARACAVETRPTNEIFLRQGSLAAVEARCKIRQ
jgi:hypothetical protein